MPIKFDTLEYTKKLTVAGVPQTQAEAQAQALHEALSEGTVTPADLLLLKTDVVARIELLKHDMDILKRKVGTLSSLLGLSLGLHAVTISILLYIIGRLP